MIFFITLLIVDLFIIKVNISLGVLYYTIIILYMIFYLVFRIFIFLLFCLLVYSIVVTSAPKFEAKTSSLFDYRGYYYLKYNYNKEIMKAWEDKRIYAIISVIIIFFLFIFVSMLDEIKYIIINYLGFNFEGNINIDEIKRNISIRFGNEIYEIEVKNKKDIYLYDIARTKIKFKEIKFNKLGKENYYLKLNHKSIFDQLGFSEWNYQYINEGFRRLGGILNLIYVILFFSILLTKFQINDEYTYRFIKYAIELGLNFISSKYFEKYGNLEKAITYYRLCTYVIISIIILVFMLKRAFLGGIKNNTFFLVAFIVSILFIIFNFVNLILTILIDVFNWIFSFAILNQINIHEEYIIIPKISIQGCLNIIILIIQAILFWKSIAYTIFIRLLKAENDKIGNENQDEIYNNEEGFEIKDKDMKIYYFQAINNTKLPKIYFILKQKIEEKKYLILKI